jgi:hypothetical protein
MNSRDFDDLTIDLDTKLLSRHIIDINGIPCAHENWIWDGIFGESLIFYKDDLKDLTEDGIFDFISIGKEVKKEGSTIKVGDKFVYFNFNFEVS